MLLFRAGFLCRFSLQEKSVALVDRLFLRIRSGHGGAGGLAYQSHTKHRMLGPGFPNGGRGGKGADIFVESSFNVTSLKHLKPIYIGQNGGPGRKGGRAGNAGAPVVIRVPVGVSIFREKELVHDLTTETRVLLAPGGLGGLGNSRGSPYESFEGEPGVEDVFELELKLLADGGFVGFPNAGKSTLLSVLTRASPKVADYPFTTLAPFLGTLEVSHDHQVRLADLPGILEGARLNVGLGLEFLRHLERTKVLLYVLDASQDVVHQYEALNFEVSSYSPEMAERPRCLILNKCDLE